MKKEIKSKLPPIFNMPLLSKILPYFGYLHSWRRLLTQLNRKSKFIWEDNIETIIFIGQDFKQERWAITKKNLSISRRSFIDLYSLFINDNDLDVIGGVATILALIKKLGEEEVLILDFHKSNINTISIRFCNEEKIYNILPAVLWPSFKINVSYFNDERTFISSIKSINQLCSKSIVIEKDNKQMLMYSVYNPTLRIRNKDDWRKMVKQYSDEMLWKWKILNWLWRPTRLQTDTFYSKESIKFIRSLSCVENINCSQFDVKINNNSEKKIINKIIKAFPKASLNLEIDFNEESTNLLLNEQLLTLVFNGNVWTFKCGDHFKTEDIQIQGRDIVNSKKWAHFAIKITKFLSKNLTFVAENNDSKIDENFQNEIKELSKSEECAYLITDKRWLWLKSNLNNIENDWKFLKVWSKAHIFIFRNFSAEDILEKIDQFPKNVEYVFELEYRRHFYCNLQILRNNWFVKTINRLKGKMQYRGFNIDIKKFNEEKSTILVNKIAKEINENEINNNNKVDR